MKFEKRKTKMRKFKYDVSFRVVHPNIDPDEVCNKLNMQAKYKWRVGDRRKTPKGTPLSGVYDYSYCSFLLDQFEEMELIDFLKHWNKKFFNFSDFLNSINSSGGNLEYFIGWYSKGNSGEVFDIDFLKELVKLKISLSIDFYVERSGLQSD